MSSLLIVEDDLTFATMLKKWLQTLHSLPTLHPLSTA